MAHKHYASMKVFMWNKIQNKYENLNSLGEFKSEIKQWNSTTCSCKTCKQANFQRIIKRDHHQILVIILDKFEWIIGLLPSQNTSENLRVSDGFRGRAELN